MQRAGVRSWSDRLRVHCVGRQRAPIRSWAPFTALVVRDCAAAQSKFKFGGLVLPAEAYAEGAVRDSEGRAAARSFEVDFTAAAARLGHFAPRDESGLVDRPGIVSPAVMHRCDRFAGILPRFTARRRRPFGRLAYELIWSNR